MNLRDELKTIAEFLRGSKKEKNKTSPKKTAINNSTKPSSSKKKRSK
jgi:hypothetical protein